MVEIVVCRGHKRGGIEPHPALISDFTPSKHRKEGRYPQCRSCDHITKKMYRDRVRAREQDIPEYKRCPQCKITKHNTGYHRNAAQVDKLEGWCIDCKGASDKLWLSNNPDKQILYSSTRRGRKKDAFQWPWTKRTQYDMHGGMCHICHKHVGYEECDMEHIRALVNGGANAPWNVAPAHKSCNSTKGYKTMKELKARGTLQRLRS